MLVQRLWWNCLITIRCLRLSGFHFLEDNKGKWTLAFSSFILKWKAVWLSVEGHHIPASSKESEQSQGLPHCCLPQSNKVPLGSAYCCLSCCGWPCTDVWGIYSRYKAVSTPFYKHVIGYGKLTNTNSGAMVPQSSAAYLWCHQDWDGNLLLTVGYTKCWTISSDTGTSYQLHNVSVWDSVELSHYYYHLNRNTLIKRLYSVFQSKNGRLFFSKFPPIKGA